MGRMMAVLRLGQAVQYGEALKARHGSGEVGQTHAVPHSAERSVGGDSAYLLAGEG